MQKTFKYEDIEQILAEADDLLQQIDPEIIEYMEEEQRAQLEQQAQRLKKLKSEVQDKIGKEGDLPPVIVPSFKLGWGSNQAIDPGGA
jgi:DNA repair exonuclease SbcCD ATPase subunit